MTNSTRAHIQSQFFLMRTDKVWMERQIDQLYVGTPMYLHTRQFCISIPKCQVLYADRHGKPCIAGLYGQFHMATMPKSYAERHGQNCTFCPIIMGASIWRQRETDERTK